MPYNQIRMRKEMQPRGYYSIEGQAKRLEPEADPMKPSVTFDWGSGGMSRGSGGKVFAAGKIYSQAAGWVAAALCLCAVAFGFTAIAVWGDDNPSYAGYTKGEAINHAAHWRLRFDRKATSPTQAVDWKLVSATHATILDRDAWKMKYNRPGKSPRCLFVWEGQDYKTLSKLTNC